MPINVNSSQNTKSELFFIWKLNMCVYIYMFNVAMIFEKFIGNFDL